MEVYECAVCCWEGGGSVDQKGLRTTAIVGYLKAMPAATPHSAECRMTDKL
jgi:hypothetical protein